MAGLLDNIGQFISGSHTNEGVEAEKDLGKTGEQVVQQGQGLIGQGTNQLQKQTNTANKLAGSENEAYQESVGANAGDTLKKGIAASEPIAQQAAEEQASGVAKTQLEASRTAGLNKGEAALHAGQAGGNAYTSTYAPALQNEQSQYNTLALQRGQQALQEQGLGLTGAGKIAETGVSELNPGLGAQSTAAQAQIDQGNREQAAGGGLLGGAISGISSLLSDVRLKTNITPSGSVEDLMTKFKSPKTVSNVDVLLAKYKDSSDPIKKLAANVTPVDFNYKPGIGEDPNKQRVGVLAQDLEKTDAKDNVVVAPDGTKTIDVPQQTGTNTNWIVQLAQKSVEQESMIKDLQAQLSKLQGK